MDHNNLISNDITYLATRTATGALLGVGQTDRLRHCYIAGMTGVGKSTLLANMLVQDFRAGRGAALIDPHGDLAHELLNHIPRSRTRDAIYFSPADMDQPIGLNVLEHVPPDKRALVADGVVSAFKHIWSDSWGPRLEHFLYNAVAALLDTPGSTLLGIPKLFTDERYRQRIVKRVSDPVVRGFWLNEFPRYDGRFSSEAISPILNKVSRFLSAPAVRNVVGQPTSSVDPRWVMDTGRLFIANLSKGQIGEQHANLLGALLITKFQLAAMSRADSPEESRRPFFLHVDEFQNYGTGALPVLLSEARKYRIGIALSNQHLSQLPPETQDALFGNVGTLVVFRVGRQDGERFAAELESLRPDILSTLPAHEIWLRTLRDGNPVHRVAGTTLPPPLTKARRHDIVVAQSKERFGRDRLRVEERIERFLRPLSNTSSRTPHSPAQ